MNFLKNLFGGGGPTDRSDYLYIRPKMCQEIVKLRIDMMNGPSLTDDGNGFYMRKLVSATRCPFQAEVELYFDKNKRMTEKQITNGEFVTEAEYQAQQEEAHA
ncbi:hypothetical protein G4Y79_01030 [Phototrophicus methaneseepsis]|uniref:Uncharacterized protein n=1 Tax=Phototrophicus methaneseepsis TaxID=2710758 RepID=A0A7S8E9R4_9CHLR|nr:hypothetical protein [Phototrophicus methaneseepsis]QPC82989.1 hypothetical protein G4Y79_01030 [Phototrophicus methaneseepsis]